MEPARTCLRRFTPGGILAISAVARRHRQTSCLRTLHPIARNRPRTDGAHGEEVAVHRRHGAGDRLRRRSRRRRKARASGALGAESTGVRIGPIERRAVRGPDARARRRTPPALAVELAQKPDGELSCPARASCRRMRACSTTRSVDRSCDAPGPHGTEPVDPRGSLRAGEPVSVLSCSRTREARTGARPRRR